MLMIILISVIVVVSRISIISRLMILISFFEELSPLGFSYDDEEQFGEFNVDMMA